ncbi:hypothetical protein H2200_008387 [Cladophialophora chaetospira]|uniref:Transcription factor Iwr1 domain-containing protein n=1 Tax=Cladophialophora chaetospira TaxID=386627 RepID=A0AA39CG23_9EURO|nr:hypothetical protein H2200_008387 [Cladophialophora chaetospira]
MSLAPERISIKRRRQEEPVETLYLEHGNGPETKRRVTDFYFQRLQNDAIAPVSQRSTPSSQVIWSKPPAPGVPPIRLTSLERSKESLPKPKEGVVESNAEEKHTIPDTPFPHTSKSAPTTPVTSRGSQQGRRFHLARHISSILSPNAAGGIRKPKISIRPPLATFIERQTAAFHHGLNPTQHDNPIDRLLEVPNDGVPRSAQSGEGKEPSLDTLQASKRVPTTTFVQPRPKKVRNGTSIKDDPDTWDLESDQLADEMAALAMELDPDLQQETKAEHSVTPPPAPKDKAVNSRHWEDDYVYETYVRVPLSGETAAVMETQSSFGILVIDEDVEDLWQKYVDSEDDSDWDEEDSNAEDNPANDYPEDEVSSDDENDYNPYKYRTFGSGNDDSDEDEHY